MRPILSRMLLLVCLLGSQIALATEPLKIGVLPYNSALALLKVHAPLRDYLSQRLGRPVEVVTSPDFFTYINDSLDGRFDVLITAPHFSVMSIDKGYVPVRRYSAPLEASLVVAHSSTLTDASALRGKRVAIASRLAVISIGGLRWLQERGLEPSRDYQVVEYPSHAAALAAVAVGEADAALVSNTMIPQTPADIRGQLKVLPTAIRLPHLMTLAHPRLGTQTIQALGKALDEFPAQPAGQAYLSNTGFGGYAPIRPEDLQALRPHVQIARSMMGLKP